MPLYVFKCKPCKVTAEVVIRIGDYPPDCPICKREMEKQIAAPAGRFPGADSWRK